ncbi:MAG: alpha-glucosidase [Acidimicrobiia bacterium]|nr:alpha-glucosidase [Acidimicrobiia bacterium]
MSKWWQSAVFYQIYPRSFADSNEDGIGDLHGITGKLDHLVDLGVDAVWLSPHFPSPNKDWGYDVADYTDVHPDYGTLDDFRELLAAAHDRGLKIVLDLVLNHTSDQHPWFVESRSSRDNPKRDWYVWHDGRDGGPPNNWQSTFGGPAWRHDEETDQWYYHFFVPEQPDLNWRNPEVKEAMFDAVRFWLDKGVDGFRLDAIGTIYEDPALPDHDVSESLLELRRRSTAHDAGDTERYNIDEDLEAMFRHQTELPETHDLMKELRRVIDEYDDRVLVGETWSVDYYGTGDDELHLNFNFPLLHTEVLTPQHILANQRERFGALPPGAWPCNTLGNHDVSRVKTNMGDGVHDDELARISAAVVLLLKGTPSLYYGEEIGMTDYYLSDPSRFLDPISIWFHHEAQGKLPPERLLREAAQFGRDKCRTPMQWSSGPNGGFSPEGVPTWLPVNPNADTGVNVADQTGRTDSLLEFYRRLLQVRRTHPALQVGDQEILWADDAVLLFRRDVGDDALWVAINMSAEAQRRDLPDGKTVFSTHRGTDDLAPFEIRIATES